MYNTEVVKQEYIKTNKSLRELATAFDIPEVTLFNHSRKEAWVKLREDFRNKVELEILAKRKEIIGSAKDTKVKKGLSFDQYLIKSYELILRKSVRKIKHALKDPKTLTKVKSLEGFMNALANVSETYRELTGKKLEVKPTQIVVIKQYEKPQNQDIGVEAQKPKEEETTTERGVELEKSDRSKSSEVAS